MKRNSPYLRDKKSPLVGLVSTPIGNLKDITYRAVEFLKSADIIACEDTRNTSLLLKAYDIHPPKLISLYAQTEKAESGPLLAEIKKKNLTLAYCSDAGMPGISDPGALLVQECYRMDVPVTILPGPSASLSALVLSGIDSADFSFFGFLPTKKGAIKTMLGNLKEREESLIFYESPKRVKATLALMKEVFGETRNASLVRELTKIHEEVIHGTLGELAMLPLEIKGECVIILEGNKKKETFSDEDLLKLLEDGIKSGESLSQVVKTLSKETGIRKNRLYELSLTLKQ